METCGNSSFPKGLVSDLFAIDELIHTKDPQGIPIVARAKGFSFKIHRTADTKPILQLRPGDSLHHYNLQPVTCIQGAVCRYHHLGDAAYPCSHLAARPAKLLSNKESAVEAASTPYKLIKTLDLHSTMQAYADEKPSHALTT